MPRVRGWNAKSSTLTDPGDQSDERTGAVRAPESEREDEHAEQRAVEDRSEPVHHLDERSELHGEVRHDARDRTPERGRDARCEEIVRVDLTGPQQASIDVDDRRAGRRAQLAGRGRHRGREDGGDDQAHEPGRKPGRHEGRKHVVDVRLRRVANRILVAWSRGDVRNKLRRPGANRSEPRTSPSRNRARARSSSDVDASAMASAARRRTSNALRELRLERAVFIRPRALRNLRSRTPR